jgi:predicted kinase
MIFTALFHDSGKPQVSHVDLESGRIRSPKHAIVGEHLSRKVLREIGCPLRLREQICRMVRYHGRPAFLLERPEPSHEVVGLSWLVSNRLLYHFALADTRGRNASDTNRPEENLEFWKVAAEEQQCFDGPYAFANPHARFQFYRQRPPNLHYVPHEEYRCTVTMLSGLPGSGKNHWLAAHRPELPVISLDDLRDEMELDATDNQGAVIQAARERCRELLRARTDFAFNATNILQQTRQRWIDLFADYQARIEIVYVEPPWPLLLEQNRQRSRSVPEQVIRTLAAKCEPPTWGEGHELVLSEGTADE